jgi:phage terminase large subunit-like protein
MDELTAAWLNRDANTADIAALLSETEERTLRAAMRWPTGAHEGQMPPQGPWRTWLMMAGRGYGKTRAGAEWVSAIARREAAGLRIALVGASFAEVRAVMVEGESGILAISPPGARPRWEATAGKLTWPNGVVGFAYSAANPERLRGSQHHYAWCDELAKWPYAQATWDNLQLGMRLGEWPRTLVTTTPRPVPLIKRLLNDADVAVTRGSTADNKALPEAFVAAMTRQYAGTRLGRQELDGALIEEIEGALWTRATLEGCRVRGAPALRRVVVGVDPSASEGGDLCGIVVAGLGTDGLGFVIEDASLRGSPERWAAAVADVAARHKADRVIAEANNGGDMVKSVLRAADAGLPVTLVRASRGKAARAEPIALLYESGRVKHVGAFPALEDELCGLTPGSGYKGPGRSPDRADALVWALTALMLGIVTSAPRVRSL